MQVNPEDRTAMPSHTSPTHHDHATVQRAREAYTHAHFKLRALVVSTDTVAMSAAGDIATARMVTVLAKEFKFTAVIAARVVHDATWAEIADMVGMREESTRNVYGPVVDRWLAGDDRPWEPA